MNQVIIYIMTVFMAVGALDYLFGNRLGLGEPFKEGLFSCGQLLLSMAGIICLAPVLANLLKPVVLPVFTLLGADPGIFAGSLLANDMGGAPLAMELAADPRMGRFGGLIIGAMLGVTIVFTIPAALGVIRKADRPFLAQGVLSGIVTIPLGGLAGGLAAGWPVLLVLQNLLPVALFALFIGLGLWLFPAVLMKLFSWFGKLVTGTAVLGLALAIIQELTGFAVIPGMTPISESFLTVGGIAIVLAGAFPMLAVITRLFQRPLSFLGRKLKINEPAVTGLIASLANSIPMFSAVKDMDPRGKTLNFAFAVSASFVFGDHLGFTAGFDPSMILPMIVAKLTGGLTALILASLLVKRQKTAPAGEEN